MVINYFQHIATPKQDIHNWIHYYCFSFERLFFQL